MRYSIVIPVFGGRDSIKTLAINIQETLAHYQYEILFVCDGCDQDTIDETVALQKMFPKRIRVFLFDKNYGQYIALQHGLEHAFGEYVITMDDDLQHDPADLIRMIDQQKADNYDLVYGWFPRLKQNFARNIASHFIRRVLKWIVPDIYPKYSPFRLFRRNIIEGIDFPENNIAFLDDFLARNSDSISHIEASHRKRCNGKSGYGVRRLFGISISILFSYLIGSDKRHRPKSEELNSVSVQAIDESPFQ